MNRRTFLKAAGAGTAVIAVAGRTLAAGPSGRRPNVILILTDDQGYGDIHSHGNAKIDTPVLDALATGGARFDRFYVNPLCAPTRASALTGRYHPRTGVSGVSQGAEVMRADEVTIAQVLKAAGYATGCFGKWHNGENYPYHPSGKGFDEFFGFCGGHWDNYFDTTLEHDGQPVRITKYITDAITDAALAFMEKHRAEPFFCYIPYNAPHEPFQVPDRYYEKYVKRGLKPQTADAYGMCENIDDNVGRILGKLDELHLAGNTVVIFFTDNGPNGQRFNAAMRGAKGSPDEGGCRVPCFVQWPGHTKPGTIVEPIAAHIDLLPTIAEICGVKDPKTLPLDGISLVALLEGRSDGWPDRAIFEPKGAVRTQRWRLTTKGKGGRLYDMAADPGQEKDVATEHPDVVGELAAAFAAWDKDVCRGLADMPPPIPVGYPEAPVVDLQAHRARTSGIKRTTPWTNSWFTAWQEVGGFVEWEIDVVRPGRFEVAIRYTCPEANVGSKLRAEAGGGAVEGAVSRAHNPDPMRGRESIRNARPEKEWATLTLGTLALEKGRTQLRLAATEIPAGQVGDVKAVRLTRLA